MRKCRIEVWDYENKMREQSPLRFRPKSYEVDAWCLQGETGFRAYFIRGDIIYTAYGDDGHWWVVGGMHKNWLDEFKETVNAIEV